MAVHVFNNKATFMLVAEDGEKLFVRPMAFADIPEKFTGDITFKRAVEAGVIQVYENNKQAEKIEEAANKPDAKPAATAKQPPKGRTAKDKGEAK